MRIPIMTDRDVLVGDVVLDAEDFKKQRNFEDAAFSCPWYVDLHFPNEAYQQVFAGNEFVSDLGSSGKMVE